jgi:outer membrane protein OmpA-like peptidoglycan-associated protein
VRPTWIKATLPVLLLASGGLAGCGSVSGLETQARILSQPSCSDFFFPIYFGGRSPDVSGAARRTMGAAALRSHGCRYDRVKVVGLPDPEAAVDAKLELSRERARRVAEALKAAGFPDPVFQLSPLGEAGVNLPSAQIPRKRADVYVRFAK